MTYHIRTARHLKTWAGEEDLITASFFFWGPGTELQNTKEGLLRTLLHQALNGMTFQTFDNVLLRWNSFALSRDMTASWTWDELKQAFRLLVDYDEFPIRFCFFIDSLDELRGDIQICCL